MTATGGSAVGRASSASWWRNQNRASRPSPSRRETQLVPDNSAETTAIPATAARSRRVTSESDQPRQRRGIACRLWVDLEGDRARAVVRLVGSAGCEAHAALPEIDGLRRQIQRHGRRRGVDAHDGEPARLRKRDYGPGDRQQPRPVRAWHGWRARARRRRFAEDETAALAALLRGELHRLARAGDHLA